MDSSLKSRLTAACKVHVEEKIARFNATVKELEEALKPESRSCMGDKYETSRAMLHLEMEKISGQMEQFHTLRKTISLISNNPAEKPIGFGSVVKTTGANYFIAVPAGEIVEGDLKFYAVGVNSPIAKVLLGKAEGDEFLLYGNKIIITEVIN